jgi:hypothetical protein
MRTLVVLGAILAAFPALGDSLRPPPEPRTAKARPIRDDLQRWRDNLTSRCILRLRDDAELNRIRGQIASFKDPTDQAAYATYFNEVILKAYNAQVIGIPGYGSYEDIEAHRRAAHDFLVNQRPQGPALAEAEVRAFIVAYKDYVKRADAERRWLNGLRAVSHCHTGDQRGQPLLENFEAFADMLEAESVKAELDKIVLPLIPTFAAKARVEALLASLRAPADLKAYAALVEEAAAVLAGLEGLEKDLAVVPLWAEILEGDARAELLATKAKAGEWRGAILDALAKLLPEIEPPAQPKRDKGLEKTATPLLKGRAGKVLAVRVLGPKAVVEEKDGKKVKVKYEHFPVAFVGDERPVKAWVDRPGLPAAEVCTLMLGTVRKHSKGVGVPLKKWIFNSDNIRLPILCKNRDKPGKPL